jgi:hypothetical protein
MGQQAGLSLDDVLSLAGLYAKHNSSNYHPENPYGLDKRTKDLTEAGYAAGARGEYGK